MQVIAVDWSGAARGAACKIWLAVAVDGRLLQLESGRDRAALGDELLRLVQAEPRTVVGLDFAFSLPAWFLIQRGLDGPALWALAAHEAEAWLAACAPPFWGRPGRPRPDLPAHWRGTELAAPAVGGIRPKSAFQIGGAGAVGTGALRGLPLLDRLRAGGCAIWPFDPPGWPRVIEIYPRLLTGPVVKSRRAERAAYLARRYPDLPPPLAEQAVDSEDAFDAAVSALVMAAHASALAALPTLIDRQTRLEGAIWRPEVASTTSPCQLP